MKLLLLEDDAGTREDLERVLSSAGHVVDACSTGQDAIFLASSSEYAVLILDRMVPGIAGLPALKAIRAAGIRTPALFLTAMNGVEDRVEGLEARHGFDHRYPNRGADDDVIDSWFQNSLSTVRPVPFVHPRTGRTLLYVAQQSTIEIVGLESEENEDYGTPGGMEGHPMTQETKYRSFLLDWGAMEIVEGFGEFAHAPRGALGEQVERVHLSLLDRLVARAVEPVAYFRTGCAATDFAPGAADADGEVVQLLLTLGAEGLGHDGG